MPRVLRRQPNHSSVVYCLTAGHRSYVGVTNNLARRLRQHNGQLRGGARYTALNRPHGKRWALHFLVTGFPKRSDALRLEWRLHGRVRLPGADVMNPFGAGSASRRAWQLYWALQGESVTRRATPTVQLRLHIIWQHEHDAEAARHHCPLPWPANITHEWAHERHRA